MGRKAKPRADQTPAERDRALERDLSAYMAGPSYIDEGLSDLERELEEAAEAGAAVRGLSVRETIYLHLALRRGRDSLRIIRELAVETFRLPGMKELALRRRDEQLAANYEALRAGGLSGDGRVTLRDDAEALLGVRGTSYTKEGGYGGPLSPLEACDALATWSGGSYSGVREALRDAKRRLTQPGDPQIGELPPDRSRADSQK